ncbi:hypothetical protein HanPI659440_Chr13g0500111 [Helianthus annuus]|nr:hypothetical protein HanPI659440_Chr13g0500111 [Helianthus annuus]
MIMVNGAFFVPSGDGLSAIYAKASSYEPKSVALVTQLTKYAESLVDQGRKELFEQLNRSQQ